jgi:UDP-N-acetylmuramate--alanine ligase
MELEVGLDAIQKALAEFAGVERRFHLVGEKRGVMIVDDYGHHPTEIKATLSAGKAGFNRRLLVVFQPHRYSRTRDLLKEFGTAFYQADSLILTEIYAAGEAPVEGITGQSLYDQVKQHGHKDVQFLPTHEGIVERLLSMARPGDMILTLGAGDVWKIGKTVLNRL